MIPRSRAPRPEWVAWSSLVMALLGAVALATTVLVARRALDDASAVVVRGEGESLVAAVQADLAAAMEGFGEPNLAATLQKHAASGLRYVGVLAGGAMRGEAGQTAARAPSLDVRAGDLVVVGSRVRLAASMAPPRNGRGGPPFGGRRQVDGLGPPPPGEPGDGPPPEDRGPGGDHRPPWERGEPGPRGAHGGPPHGPPPLLIVEFETPVLDQLRSDVKRTVVVAVVAGAALLAFAAAWSRSMLRLAAARRTAERERRLVALGQMSGVMAHELRNPLASLKGHAQLLHETLEGDGEDAPLAGAELSGARAKAARVVAEAERLERLTSSLLEFAREGPLDVRPARPADIVERATEHLRGVDLRLDLGDAPSTLVVDAGRVARALGNLVENAGQAGGDAASPVELRIAAEGAFAVLEVRDHGPGLPAVDRERLFEPFVTTKVRGTGLGLSIARRIAELHGGTLTGETHPAGGAIFRLRLPLA